MPTITKFTGLNNVTEPTSAGPGDLQKAVNVYVGDKGMLHRRTGYNLAVTSGSPPHSLNAESGIKFFVAGTNLKVLQTNSVVTVRSGISPGTMGYLWLNNKLYYSNGTDTGIYTGGNFLGWGVAAPTAPNAASATGGTLTPGKYQYAITYFRADGQESAPSPLAYCTVSDGHGTIALTSIPTSADASVTGVGVYLSSVNSEVGSNGRGLFRYTTLANAVSSVNITGPSTGQTCKTVNTTPPFAGSILAYYRGRIYIANGTTLMYTKPWMYEHMDISESYLPFQNTITNVLPVENGIWVTTTNNFMFLYGKDPFSDGGFEIRSRHNVACATGGAVVDGTMTELVRARAGQQAMFVSANGVIVGDTEGQVFNITGDRWEPPSTASGWGFVYDGQYHFGLNGVTYTMNIATGAVCTSSKIFTSMTALSGTIYATTSTGLYSGGHATDDGVAIAVEVEKQDMDFGSSLEKQLTEAYIDAASSDTFTIAVTTGGSTSTVVTAAPAGATMRGHKVDVGRGLRGRHYTVNLKSSATADQKISKIELITQESSSRHGRGNRG